MATGDRSEPKLAAGANEKMTAFFVAGHRDITNLAERFRTDAPDGHTPNGWSMISIGSKNRVSVDLRALEIDANDDLEGPIATLGYVYDNVAVKLGLKPGAVPALLVAGRNTDGQTGKLAEFARDRKGAARIVGTIYCFVEGGQVIKLTRVPGSFEDPDDKREPVFKADSEKLLLSPMTSKDYASVHFIMCDMLERMDTDWKNIMSKTTPAPAEVV
jgi:hypothetical protein